MANESATKPTYSELEANRDAWKRDYEHEKERTDAVKRMGGIVFQYFEKDKPLYALNLTAHELREELERVRGLLQRQWISVEERLPECVVGSDGVSSSDSVLVWFSDADEAGRVDCFTGIFLHNPKGDKWWIKSGGFPIFARNVTHWMPLPTFPQSSSLVPQGAESADIGKLDTVDKKSDG